MDGKVNDKVIKNLFDSARKVLEFEGRLGVLAAAESLLDEVERHKRELAGPGDQVRDALGWRPVDRVARLRELYEKHQEYVIEQARMKAGGYVIQEGKNGLTGYFRVDWEHGDDEGDGQGEV